ncbi:competence type IV pilus major pilin ComGC [Shouchella shacheensis]|uniref:competence type IV pilus major pilin ComGC n=1 Tax=Shouchella shacheensis TaxID=1649580 RepID=UPI0009E69B4A|nr:competence type IV pilus major pilin ComGC [Shouchella shacheensis]
MKTVFRNQRGFTLVEMLVVLMIISILLLIALPNMTKNNDTAAGKSCEATQKLLQTQVVAYEVEQGSPPANLETLVTEGYVDTASCTNGQTLQLNGKEVVISS